MREQQSLVLKAELMRYVVYILKGRSQPSAEELMWSCINEFGEAIKPDLKEAVVNLLGSKTLSRQNKAYLHHLIEERTLDKALATPSAGNERQRVVTGIDQLVQAGIWYRQSENSASLLALWQSSVSMPLITIC